MPGELSVTLMFSVSSAFQRVFDRPHVFSGVLSLAREQLDFDACIALGPHDDVGYVGLVNTLEQDTGSCSVPGPSALPFFRPRGVDFIDEAGAAF